uniref:Uncharacterized protein n=1 Tax=Octopus bimaculoides TaxID=37653 RepID=A0A0L8I0M1_OCTBM
MSVSLTKSYPFLSTYVNFVFYPTTYLLIYLFAGLFSSKSLRSSKINVYLYSVLC